MEVVEARDNAIQVADSVAIRILKAARINFINDGVFPPMIFGVGGSMHPHVEFWMFRGSRHGKEDNQKNGKREDRARGKSTLETVNASKKRSEELGAKPNEKITTPVVSKTGLLSVNSIRTRALRSDFTVYAKEEFTCRLIKMHVRPTGRNTKSLFRLRARAKASESSYGLFCCSSLELDLRWYCTSTMTPRRPPKRRGAVEVQSR